MVFQPLSTRLATVIALCCSATAMPALSAQLIQNGGFESGFSSWTRVDQVGSEGTFSIQTGLLSPVNGDSTPEPTEGDFAAMTDAYGSGSHVLYQDFLVSSANGFLSFDLFIGNRAPQFATPPGGSLAFDLTSQLGANTLNQQARVDIVKASADPFSVDSSDVLLNLFATADGDSLISGYTSYSFNLDSVFSAYLGQTLRLRFAETDNILPFQFGVDNVSLDTSVTVPEPGSIALLGLGLVAFWYGCNFQPKKKDNSNT